MSNTPTSTQAAATSTPATLAALETFFQTQIQSAGQVAITQANTGIVGLTTMLNQTVGPNLVISSPLLTLANTTLGLTGTLTFLNTAFNVSLAFTEANGAFDLVFTGTQQANTSISLSSLVEQLVPSATNAPALQISALQIAFDTTAATFLFSATVTWSIPLGATSTPIAATLAISQTGATLSGSLSVGQASFTVSYVLQKGGQVLTGAWANSTTPLGWTDIARALHISIPQVPNNAVSGFISAQLSLDFSTYTFTLSGQTADGAALLEASKQGQQWGFAFGAAVAANWTFSELSGSLSVVDFLVFQDAYLLVSSFPPGPLSFPNFAPMTTPINASPGLNFGGVINFAAGTSALAKSVYSLVGTSTASVEGTVGTMANTRLTASLGGSMIIPPAKNLLLTNPEFILIASPFTVEIQGTLQVALGSQTVDITGRVGISATEADFTVDVAGSSLLAPFGFTGVTLEEIGASIGIGFIPISLDLTLEATFQVGSTPADKCAIDFEAGPDEINPVLLWGQFSSLSFPTIFNAMFPTISLPPVLSEVSLQNAYIFYCEQPTVLPDNTSVSPGFAISGTLNAFSFTMAASLVINFTSGVSGSAAMTPIRLMNDAISVTGHGSLGGPAVAFNTTSSPFLNVTLDVRLMGIVGAAINGTVTSSGFTFYLSFTIPPVQLNETLTCTFADYTDFSASSALQFNLNFAVGPLKPPQTNINLGYIKVNTSFTGNLAVAINSTTASGSVSNGSFNGRSLPSFSFNASTASLHDLPSVIEKQIQAEADTIYADVLSNASEWASMVSSGAISGADDVAKVLTGYFNESTSAAQTLMQQFKLHGNTTVHVDTTFPHVDAPSVFADVPASHIDTSSVHLDTPSVHTDYSDHVDGHPFHTSYHDDTGGHHDGITIPHGDAGGHADTTVTPHVDSSTPHGDTTPHTDSSTHIDI
jgi:hypothetical protein